MDFCDIASEIEARNRADALSLAGLRPPDPGPYYVNGVAHCRECLEPIPEARLRALPGVGLCVRCAEDAG